MQLYPAGTNVCRNEMQGEIMKSSGLVIWAHDFGPFWIKLASQAKLTTLGIHPIPAIPENDFRSLESLLAAMKHSPFQENASMLRDNGINLEIYAHVMHWILPPSLFHSHPDWFRMDESGMRCADLNFCPSNGDALQYVEKQTELLAETLSRHTTTHRYHLWIDDNSRFCHCDACRKLSASDQALLIQNHMLAGIKKIDPSGTLGYLAYQNTITVPQNVSPAPGMFLEYAPVDRDSRFVLNDTRIASNIREFSYIEALMKYFGTSGAQVLEYWMDTSYFYRWTPPYGELPFYRGVIAKDIQLYKECGFEHITSFACGLNEAYAAEYGISPVVDYGKIINGIFHG